MDGNGEANITNNRISRLEQKRMRAPLRKRGKNGDRWL
jgi:hypothetical protein